MKIYGLDAIEQAAKACTENTWFDLLGEKFYVLSVARQLVNFDKIACAEIELCQVRRKDEKHFE